MKHTPVVSHYRIGAATHAYVTKLAGKRFSALHEIAPHFFNLINQFDLARSHLF